MLHPAEPGDPLLYRRLRRLGRLTVAERLQALCDPGSFEESEPDVRELDGTPALGVRCGFAQVHGVAVAVYAHDPALRRGALGAGSAGKVARLLTEAARRGTPVLALHHCDGVRVEEGIRAVQGWEALLGGHVRLQGVVPQLAAVLGTGVGASAYAVALCDLVVMVRERSFLFVVGPRGVKQATGQDVGMDDLGGADVHARSTGIAHALVDDDRAAIARLRAWVQVFGGPAPGTAADASIAGLIPSDFRRPYDVRPVLDALGDAPLDELQPDWARNLVVGFLRIGGRAVGVLASQPKHLAGCLDVLASRKGAAFVRLCDAFGVPIVTFVDVPGYLPGPQQEAAGILRFGADLLTAYGRTTTRSIAVVLRKSYGGASVLSCTADRVLALPGAKLSSMGADAARVALGERAGDPDGAPVVDETLETAVAAGYVHEVVAPDALRDRLIALLDAP